MNEEDTLYCKYQSLISEGESLLQDLKEGYSTIRGITKLQHKIKSDNKCLTEALLCNKLKKEHICCTNLTFYKGLVEEMCKEKEPEAVLETFLYRTSDCFRIRLTVDLVSEKGRKWTKIISRNPLALHHIYKEGDGFGRRSILDQAKSYLQASHQNLILYHPPQVIFSFINGVPEKMKSYLEQIGISVNGEVLALETEQLNSCTDSDNEDSTHPLTCASPHVPSFPNEQQNTKKLNLCVTAMIAYVSALTNGGCNKKFLEPLLNQQAEWERLNPVKPQLIHLFEGKTLIACSTAVADFRNIIENIGGPEEKLRAETLLARIEVVPDVSFDALKPSGQIKARSLVIFGTGHHHRSVTVSANKGFLHASKQKGVNFAVVIHESRALTERKELPQISL